MKASDVLFWQQCEQMAQLSGLKLKVRSVNSVSPFIVLAREFEEEIAQCRATAELNTWLRGYHSACINLGKGDE